MANPKHVEILKQGVEVWNKWRDDNPEVKPDFRNADLRETNLVGADLSGANFREAVLKEIKLFGADLKEANFQGANLVGADLSGVDLYKAFFYKTSLLGADFIRADLQEAKLIGADLTGADLSGAFLIQTKFTNADITGVKLYGTARDDWKIDGIKCDYVYFYKDSKERTPKDRDFKPGEFEELYKSLPTIEYHFQHGFTPIDPIIMNQVVTGINEKHPEFELQLDSFHSRGTPHAKFTVLHKEHVEPVLEQIKMDYETRLKVLEGQKGQLMEVISMMTNKPSLIQNITNSQVGVIGDKATVQGDISQELDKP